jgi:HEPN domain-containing protein
MPNPTPTWGNFIFHADQDLISFAWLYSGGLRLHAYYHIEQAVEKYLKALALSVEDPGGATLTADNSPWIKSHNLRSLAQRVVKKHPYYGTAEVTKNLDLLIEFDQATRYPWVKRVHGNGFTSADVPMILDLITRLRTDIPIVCDDYHLGILVRGHFQGLPDSIGLDAEHLPARAALLRVFPGVVNIVRY